jgi:hypothetical protein
MILIFISFVTMFDYSVYEKPSSSPFSLHNPIVRFRILLADRKINIAISVESSLEDLYVKIYNAVYPEFSYEKPHDSIPASSCRSYEIIPKLYHVAVCNKSEHSIEVPLHRFITISSFMKSRPDYFENISNFGTPLFLIYVIDEKCLFKMQNPEPPVLNHYSGATILNGMGRFICSFRYTVKA